jgi:hypothetical protein
MRKAPSARTLAVAAALLLAAIRPAVASEENIAAARIEAMASLLAKTQRLRVAADCTYDVVQDSGEKIEFGERRELTLRRPDRARVDVTLRDGSRRGLIFDGTQLITFDLGEKVYAAVSKSGTVDAALDHYEHDLGMRLPLRKLFGADLQQELREYLPSARLVGEETVGGVAADHVALRAAATDVQLWIARAGDALPQRIVITYRREPGQPRFTADFQGWTLNPDVPDSAFAFVPPEGAEKIPILTPGRGRTRGKQP